MAGGGGGALHHGVLGGGRQLAARHDLQRGSATSREQAAVRAGRKAEPGVASSPSVADLAMRSTCSARVGERPRWVAMEVRTQSDPSEEFLESFTPNIAGIVQAYSFVDDDESKYLQITPVGSDDFDFDNFLQEEKVFEDQKITQKGLSDAYQNVLNRPTQLQKPRKISKGADRRKRWKGGLELEPWMGTVVDGWKKDMLLEDLVDIDIFGYDAPPPSFTAGVELKKQRRARIEAAKQRIDAIRKESP
ncbi:unnamed protein product [Urochloa humidicola]